MKTLPDCRRIEVTLSRRNIIDQIAALLYATGLVRDDEEVLDIMFDRDETYLGDTVKTIIDLRKHQEIDFVQHN